MNLSMLLSLLTLFTSQVGAEEGTRQSEVLQGGDVIADKPPVQIPCRDRYGFCPRYASEGHCTLNAGWMTLNCPISCEACHLLDPAVRCSRQHLNMSSVPAYQAGDMDAMFAGLQDQYGGGLGVDVLSRDPWVVAFNDFMSPAEADAIVARQTNWQQSTETGGANALGESTGPIKVAARTSFSSWCFSECENDPLVADVLNRIETVTRIPRGDMEPLQVLKCE